MQKRTNGEKAKPAQRSLFLDSSGVGQTSGLPVHGASGSMFPVASKRRARGPANRQTGGLPHAPT
jgi:hypothetical protein